jgi:hypothetical protein
MSDWNSVEYLQRFCLERSLVGLERLAEKLDSKDSGVFLTPVNWKWPSRSIPESVKTLCQGCLATYRTSSIPLLASSQPLVERERRRIELLIDALEGGVTDDSSSFSPANLFELRVRVAEFQLLVCVYTSSQQVCLGTLLTWFYLTLCRLV